MVNWLAGISSGKGFHLFPCLHETILGHFILSLCSSPGHWVSQEDKGDNAELGINKLKKDFVSQNVWEQWALRRE